MDLTQQPPPPQSLEAAQFATVIRSLLRLHPASPVDTPIAVEHWNSVEGYRWQWATTRGQWTVQAGAILDPRAHIHGPAGQWAADGYDAHAAELVIALLRLAGALPSVSPPADRLPSPTVPPQSVQMRPATAAIRGQRYDAPGPAQPVQAVFWRPGVVRIPATIPPDMADGQPELQQAIDCWVRWTCSLGWTQPAQPDDDITRDSTDPVIALAEAVTDGPRSFERLPGPVLDINGWAHELPGPPSTPPAG